jgi:peptide/nickel transport system permease protein
VGLSAVIVIVATALLFAMIYVIPGDPARVALGPRASEAMLAAFRARMGIDRPVWQQFLTFGMNVLRGDLGEEVISNRPVLTVLMDQFPYTLSLIVFGMTWSIVIGIPLGCLAAARRGSIFDRLVGILSVSVIAVPSFVIAIYALLIFAVQLQWLPAVGAGERGDFISSIRHLLLPSLAVGLGWVGYLARMIRASMLDVLSEQHIRTARGLGLSETRILYVYALRIAILPTVTLLGVGIGQMISSAVFIEIVFARPGLGKLVYDAIIARNIPLVTGGLLITTIFFVVCNLLADLLVGVLDPRVRSNFSNS